MPLAVKVPLALPAGMVMVVGITAGPGVTLSATDMAVAVAAFKLTVPVAVCVLLPITLPEIVRVAVYGTTVTWVVAVPPYVAVKVITVDELTELEVTAN